MWMRRFMLYTNRQNALLPRNFGPVLTLGSEAIRIPLSC